MSPPDRAPQEPQVPPGQAAPSEEELRAAYEAELSRVTSAEMVLQAAVSLINIGGFRLGAAGGGEGGAEQQRDLEQVRDAIDGVRGLLPVLERRMPGELGALRDALSRLQMAYAREAAAGAGQAPPAEGAQGPGAGDKPRGRAPQEGEQPGERRPGPAESSGRLWVPGR
jgi:hypothetical protein